MNWFWILVPVGMLVCGVIAVLVYRFERSGNKRSLVELIQPLVPDKDGVMRLKVWPSLLVMCVGVALCAGITLTDPPYSPTQYYMSHLLLLAGGIFALLLLATLAGYMIGYGFGARFLRDGSAMPISQRVFTFVLGCILLPISFAFGGYITNRASDGLNLRCELQTCTVSKMNDKYPAHFEVKEYPDSPIYQSMYALGPRKLNIGDEVRVLVRFKEVGAPHVTVVKQ